MHVSARMLPHCLGLSEVPAALWAGDTNVETIRNQGAGGAFAEKSGCWLEPEPFPVQVVSYLLFAYCACKVPPN